YEIGLGRGGVALDVWSGTGRRSRLRIVARGGRLGSPRAAAELPGRVNYFLGADRRKWLRGVATFARVGYENVWPGVGLVFHGRQGVLEFDFDLAPGAQGGRVALGFRGARAIRL